MDLGHRPGRPPCTSQLAGVATVEADRHGPGCCRSRILLLPSVQAYLELLQAAAWRLRLICFHADHNASVDYSRWPSHRGWTHVYQTLTMRKTLRSIYRSRPQTSATEGMQLLRDRPGIE